MGQRRSLTSGLKGWIRVKSTELLFASATDITSQLLSGSCMVLAPHPDDETLGCGGLIAMKRSVGSPVRIVVATDGSSGQPSDLIAPEALARMRRSETLEATRLLGVSSEHVQFLEFRDKSLHDGVDELTELLARMISEAQPDEIMIPSRYDRHPDHRAMNVAARRSMAAVTHQTTIYEYPIWFWDRWPWLDTNLSSPLRYPYRLIEPLVHLKNLRSHVVDVSPWLDTKLNAIRSHDSQVRRRHPRWNTLPVDMMSNFCRPQEMLFMDDQHGII